MREHLVYAVQSAVQSLTRPSRDLTRIPALRVYTTPAGVQQARREISSPIQVSIFRGEFPESALFGVGHHHNCRYILTAVLKDFTQALELAQDRSLFRSGQGSIDLFESPPVFDSAAAFLAGGRTGIALLDWRGLSAEFFITPIPAQTLAAQTLAAQTPRAAGHRSPGICVSTKAVSTNAVRTVSLSV